MSKPEQLEAFVKVIEEGSFAAAGAKLCLTPAAISKQLKTLESALGVELIKRTTRNLHLTEAGNRYFQDAKTVLEKLLEADHAILSTNREPAGVLKILSTRYYAEQVLLKKLPQFLEAYPKINVKIELAERLPDLMREDLDFLFGVTIKPINSDLARQALGTTRYVFCASPAYLAKYGTPKQPQDLKLHRYLTHAMRQKPNFISFKGQPDVYVESYLWLNDSKALRECALKGLGIVKLHDYVVKQQLADGSLVEIYPQFVEPTIPVYCYYRQARAMDPKVKAFTNFYQAPDQSNTTTNDKKPPQL